MMLEETNSAWKTLMKSLVKKEDGMGGSMRKRACACLICSAEAEEGVQVDKGLTREKVALAKMRQLLMLSLNASLSLLSAN